MITIPFDLELAKKINNGERNGMIVTDGDNYRVEFVYHREESFPILGVIHTDHGIISDWFSNNGFGGKNYRLKLKVPEYTTFKDGDVLSNEQGDYLFILNANVVAYGAMVDLIKKIGRLNLNLNNMEDERDFPAEIRIFTDNGLVCLSITSIYLSGEDNLMVDGYDDDNEKIEGVDVYYYQISEVVYLAKIILEEMEEKDHGESS